MLRKLCYDKEFPLSHAAFFSDKHYADILTAREVYPNSFYANLALMLLKYTNRDYFEMLQLMRISIEHAHREAPREYADFSKKCDLQKYFDLFETGSFRVGYSDFAFKIWAAIYFYAHYMSIAQATANREHLDCRLKADQTLAKAYEIDSALTNLWLGCEYVVWDCC